MNYQNRWGEKNSAMLFVWIPKSYLTIQTPEKKIRYSDN